VRVLALTTRDSAVLSAGQGAQIAAGSRVTVQPVDVAQMTAWRSGKLMFRDQALSDVATTLEQWYGIHVVIADSSLARGRLTALFQQQPLTEVLDAIAATLDARYERAGARVTFFPK
jgi:transmembrane sensor